MWEGFCLRHNKSWLKRNIKLAVQGFQTKIRISVEKCQGIWNIVDPQMGSNSNGTMSADIFKRKMAHAIHLNGHF